MSSWLLLPSIGVFLELMLLARGLSARVFTRYYFFYIYICSSLVGTLAAVAIHASSPGSFAKWYWPIQFVTLIFGYGILLEILNHVLAPYPGAEKFARTSGLVAFAATFCFALIAPLVMPAWSASTVLEFERDSRFVQCIFIFVLLAVILYYAIPMGRNMKGMLVGYGLYIATSMMSLAIRAYGSASLMEVWRTIQPLSFDVSMFVWLVALWSYCPNPVPDASIRLEEDYEALALRTRNMMDSIRTHLRKAARA